MTAARAKLTRAREDNPPPTFSELRDFRWPWREWSPREEADYVRWCPMEDGTSYDDADVELRAVTTLLRPQHLTPWQRISSDAREPSSPNARRKAA
jgi:hypothetical protein